MGMAAASACKARRRWFRLTPDGGVVLMLALEGFLLLSAWFRWFPFNQHKGWTVLICIASVGAALLLMFLWFLAALVFRWRFQFSILALLLLVVVVTVPCSWLTTEMKAARQQKAALQGLQKAGVLAWYDGELNGPSRDNDWLCGPGLDIPFGSRDPQWPRALLGDDFFTTVNRVLFYGGSRVSDDSLACLKQLPDLRELHLEDTRISDAGLEHLKGLTNLQYLYLGWTKVTDAGVKKLQQALPNCRIYH